MSQPSNFPSASSLSPVLHQRHVETLSLEELLRLLGVPKAEAVAAAEEPYARLAASSAPKAGAAARAALELARRVALDKAPPVRLASPESVAEYLRPQLGHLLFERFVVLSFDPRNALLSCDTISDGQVDACIVDARLVFDVALRAGATGVILAHNHPSGSAEPSVSDVSLSRRLSAVGKALGVRVLDSLVITRHGHTSLTGRGLLDGPCSLAEVG